MREIQHAATQLRSIRTQIAKASRTPADARAAKTAQLTAARDKAQAAAERARVAAEKAQAAAERARVAAEKAQAALDAHLGTTAATGRSGGVRSAAAGRSSGTRLFGTEASRSRAAATAARLDGLYKRVVALGGNYHGEPGDAQRLIYAREDESKLAQGQRLAINSRLPEAQIRRIEDQIKAGERG